MTPKAVEHLEALDREITAALAAEAVGALSSLDEYLTGILKATNNPPSDDPTPEVERYSRRRLRDAMSLIQDEVIEELQWTAIAGVLNVDNVELLYRTLRDPTNVKGHLRRQVKQTIGTQIGFGADILDGAWSSSLLRGYNTGGGWAARELTGRATRTFELRDKNILNAIRSRSRQLAGRWDDRFNDDLSGWLTNQMLDEGRNPLDAKRHLRGRGWTDLTGWQIDRIARTESAVSVGWGKFDTYLKNGVEFVEWQAHVDGKTRHSHRALDGQTVRIGERFSNGLRFPGDPSAPAREIINCRCNLAAVAPNKVDPAHLWDGQGTPHMPVAMEPTRADSRRMVEHVYRTTMENGGATWNPRTGQYQHSGYAVAEVHGTFARVPMGDREAFERAVNRLRTEYPDAYVGTWDDGEGTIHVDPSTIYRSRKAALEAAREREQLAVFHLDTFTEIETANPLKDVMVNIRQETAGLRYEKAYVLDPESGEIEYEKHGDTYSVTLPRGVEYRNKVLVHNHPLLEGDAVSMPLSDNDFGVFFQKKLRDMRATGSDGTYIIHKPSEWQPVIHGMPGHENDPMSANPPDPFSVMARSRAIQTELVNDPDFPYKGQPDYGGDEGHRYVLTEMNERLAEELGLEFRFEPADDDLEWATSGTHEGAAAA